MSLILSVGIVWVIATYFQPMSGFRFDFIGQYVDWANTRLSSRIKNESYRKGLIVLLPLLILGLLIFDLKLKRFYLLSIILNTFVLWLAWMYRGKTEIIPGSVRAKEEEIFYAPLTGSFTIVFWFFFSGPLGVLLYDLVRRLQIFPLKPLLEWPASRTLGFGYALAGHFSPVFNYWSRHFFSYPVNDMEFVKNCGLYALYGEKESQCESEEKLEYAVALVRRAKIMLFLIVLIFCVGVWL